jgi:hypothetical protein
MFVGTSQATPCPLVEFTAHYRHTGHWSDQVSSEFRLAVTERGRPMFTSNSFGEAYRTRVERRIGFGVPPLKMVVMRHSDFSIGTIFWCSGRQWRCTDLGQRIIVAIRIDEVDVDSTGPSRRGPLSREEAEAGGWFSGPPYGVAEVVLDEHDLPACSLNAG